MTKLILIKKGDVKSGFLSITVASEIKFYEDKIVASPMGWNRIFNNSDTIIEVQDMIRIRFTWRGIGYNISIQTMDKNYIISLMWDKLEMTRVVELYQNLIEDGGQPLRNPESLISEEKPVEHKEEKDEIRVLLCPKCKNPINKSEKNCEWCGCEL